jgi:4-amino-4-deoxy-L-arabinose transferase-like glycosyltransferase
MRLSPAAEPPPAASRALLGTQAICKRLMQGLTSEQAAIIAFTVAIILALLAPLGPMAANRFHRDEAIYSSWGLDIASGRDLLLSGSPVDKPPLFLYIQALSFVLFGPTEVAARLPSLIASVVSVGLIYALGRSLYGRDVGLLAAFLLAASPFRILFAPTAFTDPIMVAWVLAGCLATVRGHWGRAGIFLGLATITKQQGVFFVPLALGLGHISNIKSANLQSQATAFVMPFLAVLGLAIGWDVARARQPGFLAQSLANYGGLSLAPVIIWGRLLGFWSLLRYATGSPVLNGILLAGLPLLVIADILAFFGLTGALRWRKPDPLPQPLSLGGRGEQADLVLLAFTTLFLLGHSLVAFQVWDRYLLGLVPLLALLLARVLTLPRRWLKDSPFPNFLSMLFVLWMLSFTRHPIRDAAASRFPIGGDHGAYQGIEQVVDYLQNIPADTTLYHRWLGWHWRFYLWGSPYDFRAWISPTDLAAQAAARPGARRYIVFPSWHSSTEARLALAEAGLTLREMHRAFRDDGSVSFIVYRIEETR